MPAFTLPHFDQIVERPFESLLHGRPGLVGINCFFWGTHHPRRLQDGVDGNFTWGAELFLQRAHGVVIGARQGYIECEPPRSVTALMQSHQNVGSPPRNPGIDCLADSRFELGQISWQVNHDLALLAIHGAEFDAQFRPFALRFAAAISGHASHGDALEAAKCFAAVATSLSPRPEQFMIMIALGSKRGATFAT